MCTSWFPGWRARSPPPPLVLPRDRAEVDQHEEDREDDRPERPDLRQPDLHAFPPLTVGGSASLPPASAGATSWTTILVSRSARWICASPRKESPALKHIAHIKAMPINHHTICHDQSGGKPRNENAELPMTANGPMAKRYHTGTATHIHFLHVRCDSLGRSMSFSHVRISRRRSRFSGDSVKTRLKTKATTRPTSRPQPAEW